MVVVDYHITFWELVELMSAGKLIVMSHVRYLQILLPDYETRAAVAKKRAEEEKQSHSAANNKGDISRSIVRLRFQFLLACLEMHLQLRTIFEYHIDDAAISTDLLLRIQKHNICIRVIFELIDTIWCYLQLCYLLTGYLRGCYLHASYLL